MENIILIKDDLRWRVHTANLLQEILDGYPGGAGPFKVPIKIFSIILGQLAERCSELNDDQLNSICARLALYEVTDPCSAEYDAKLTKELIEKG